MGKVYKLYQGIKGDCGSPAWGIGHLGPQVGGGSFQDALSSWKGEPMGRTPPERLE